jgi:hypothetical protein
MDVFVVTQAQLSADAGLSAAAFVARHGNVFLVVETQPMGDIAQQLRTTSHLPADMFRQMANPDHAPSFTAFQLAKPGDGAARFFRLGRAPDCEFVLNQTSVSRLHALIMRTADGSLRIKDIGSRAGVKLNDDMLEDRKSMPLAVGGHVDIGGLRLSIMNAAGLLGLLHHG